MKIDLKMLSQAMGRLGIKQEEIPAKRVIIVTDTSEIIVEKPSVSKVAFGGNEVFQVSGAYVERELQRFSDNDVNLVASQTGTSVEKARQELEKNNGDIAAAILSLKKE